MKVVQKIVLATGLLGAAALAVAIAHHLFSRHPVGNEAVPQPAKAVELPRYLGRWYEIARYEQRFQEGCDGVTADYGLSDDGAIEVVNRCRKPDGKIEEARGRAIVADIATNAKLKVSFFGPFYGDYWIVDHGEDYSWSIVGEPSGRYLWILARSPTLPQAEVSALIGRAKALGYDTAMLRRTAQP